MHRVTMSSFVFWLLSIVSCSCSHLLRFAPFIFPPNDKLFWQHFSGLAAKKLQLRAPSQRQRTVIGPQSTHAEVTHGHIWFQRNLKTDSRVNSIKYKSTNIISVNFNAPFLISLSFLLQKSMWKVVDEHWGFNITVWVIHFNNKEAECPWTHYLFG